MPADFNSLTSKQKKVYSAIEAFVKTRGIPPTVREIGEMIGEKTPGAVQGILNRLEQKGVIKREVGMARSIQLVSDNSQYAAPVYVPRIKKISRRNVSDLFSIYNIERYEPMPPDMIDTGKKCFLINCPDNSLMESGIKYGDVLVAALDTELNDGDIVFVLYDNHLLLRRYFADPQQTTVTLKADTYFIDKETFNKDEIIIIAKLAAKFTRF